MHTSYGTIRGAELHRHAHSIANDHFLHNKLVDRSIVSHLLKEITQLLGRDGLALVSKIDKVVGPIASANHRRRIYDRAVDLGHPAPAIHPDVFVALGTVVQALRNIHPAQGQRLAA